MVHVDGSWKIRLKFNIIIRLNKVLKKYKIRQKSSKRYVYLNIRRINLLGNTCLEHC